MKFDLDNYIYWTKENEYNFKIILDSLPEKEFYFLGVFGAWTGQSSLAMIEFVRDRESKAAIYTIDTFKGFSNHNSAHIAKRYDVKDVLLNNLREQNVEDDNNLEIYTIDLTSELTSKFLPPKSFDLFLVDTDPSPKMLNNTVLDNWHLIKEDGCMVIKLDDNINSASLRDYFSHKAERIEYADNFMVVWRKK